MKVKHALIAYDLNMYKAFLNGEVPIKDANGFSIGLECSLADGTRIFIRPPLLNP